MNKIEKQAPSGRVSRFTRSEIDLLFQTGKAVYKSKEFVILTTPCISFSVGPNKSGRILLITSRKVGNAPERNLLRRRGRAIFYEEKLFELGKHCVIIFKSPAKLLSFDQFKEILKKAMEKKLPVAVETTPTTPLS
ncbi:MAG: ribonuclease P protein component [Candidatus Chromulinivorax sp.]|nr:ribonuclease P protein component [Candidatus Chromulinivorax sp.]